MFISIESIKGGKPTISIDSNGTETIEQVAEAYLKLKSLIGGRKKKAKKAVKQEVQNVPNL